MLVIPFDGYLRLGFTSDWKGFLPLKFGRYRYVPRMMAKGIEIFMQTRI